MVETFLQETPIAKGTRSSDPGWSPPALPPALAGDFFMASLTHGCTLSREALPVAVAFLPDFP